MACRSFSATSIRRCSPIRRCPPRSRFPTTAKRQSSGHRRSVPRCWKRPRPAICRARLSGRHRPRFPGRQGTNHQGHRLARRRAVLSVEPRAGNRPRRPASSARRGHGRRFRSSFRERWDLAGRRAAPSVNRLGLDLRLDQSPGLRLGHHRGRRRMPQRVTRPVRRRDRLNSHSPVIWFKTGSKPVGPLESGVLTPSPARYSCESVACVPRKLGAGGAAKF